VQIAALRASFAAVAEHAQLLVCSGNHDLNVRNPAGEMTAEWLAGCRRERVAVDGDSIELEDTLFSVCPWWEGPNTQAALERQLAEAATRRRERWVWVYHAPPKGALSWTGKQHFGDPLLPTLIARHRPTAVLCGHVHEAPFKLEGSWIDRIDDTWVFNPGHESGDIPARIEIDLDQGYARWSTSEGTEEQPLI
jgi:hypothetical protein